jgi:hypothetical protein
VEHQVGAYYGSASLQQQLFMLAREAGLERSQISIDGLEKAPRQLFQVVVPIVGVRVEAVTRLGNVALHPVSSVAGVLPNASPLYSAFVQHEAFFVCYRFGQLLYETEEPVLSEVRQLAARINVRERYSGALTPRLEVVDSWDRSRLQTHAYPSDLILVQGLTNGESWLRRRNALSAPADAISRVPAELGAHSGKTDGLSACYLAASRAATSQDASTRVSAIWECLEFYAAGTTIDYGFTSAERKAIISAVVNMSEGKKARVGNLVAKLNEAPLMARIRARLSADEVPVTESELKLLRGLRRARNDMAHGRETSVTDTDVDRGVALVSRILEFASARRRDEVTRTP